METITVKEEEYENLKSQLNRRADEQEVNDQINNYSLMYKDKKNQMNALENELITIRNTVKQYKNDIKNLDHEMIKLKKKWLRSMKDTTNMGQGYMNGNNQTGATLASSESAMRQMKDESYNWYMGYSGTGIGGGGGGNNTNNLNNSGNVGLGNSFITVTNASTPHGTNTNHRQSFDMNMNDINDSRTLSAAGTGTFSRLISSRQQKMNQQQQQQVTPQHSIMSVTQVAPKGPETADLQLGGTW